MTIAPKLYKVALVELVDQIRKTSHFMKGDASFKNISVCGKKTKQNQKLFGASVCHTHNAGITQHCNYIKLASKPGTVFGGLVRLVLELRTLLALFHNKPAGVVPHEIRRKEQQRQLSNIWHTLHGHTTQEQNKIQKELH